MPSARDRRDEFGWLKRDVLARLSDAAALGESRWEISRRLRAIDIDSPRAHEQLAALEQTVAEHPEYGAVPGLSPIRWDINWLMMRAKYDAP